MTPDNVMTLAPTMVMADPPQSVVRVLLRVPQSARNRVTALIRCNSELDGADLIVAAANSAVEADAGDAASPPLCPPRDPPQSVAACLSRAAGSILSPAERATEARKDADRLACEAWNERMLGFQGPAQPSPALGDAINAGFGYLEVKCLGCNTHQTVALDIVRRPKATPVHELERYMRCKDCSQVRGYPYKRSHLVALRATKITASDPPSTWWPGER
jgi:hypothetical protein